MSDEKKNRLSDEDRILAHAAPTLIPVLERKRDGALAKLRREYYSNAPDSLRPIVGEYVVICELIRDLEVKLQNLQGEK